MTSKWLVALRRWTHRHLLYIPQYELEINKLSLMYCPTCGSSLVEPVKEALAGGLYQGKLVRLLEWWHVLRLPKQKPFDAPDLGGLVCHGGRMPHVHPSFKEIKGCYSLRPARSPVRAIGTRTPRQI